MMRPRAVCWALVLAPLFACGLPHAGAGSTAMGKPSESFPISYSREHLPSASPSAVAANTPASAAPAASVPAPRGTQSRPSTEPVAAAAPAPVAPAPVAPAPGAIIGAPQRTAYALVVGIGHYRDLPPAVGAREDAQRFAALLRQTFGISETNLHLAIDDRVTRSDLQQQLAWLASSVQRGGRAYLYFSGHGSPREKDGATFLVPYDASPNAVIPTSIALSDVAATLASSRARDAMLVIDACFSGAGGRSVLAAGARPLMLVREVKPTSKLALFSSASGSQISGPAADGSQGLFTKYFIEAIATGLADHDGDGQITLLELAQWVTPRVTREARESSREQTPRLAVGTALGQPGDIPLIWGLR